MANDNISRGLVPVNWPFIPAHYYRVATGNDMFLGEIVDLATSGYVTNAFEITTAGIIRALGAVVGFAGPGKKGLACDDPYLDASDLTTLASGLEAGDRWVLVADDPNQEFIIQADTGATMAGLSSVGESFPLLWRATSGNTTSGWALLELDAGSNAASTGQIVVNVGLADVVNVDGTENTAAANYAKWRVKIQTHRRSIAGAV